MDSKRTLFTGQERTILLELVGKYKHILENKKSDCISLSQKKKTWNNLAEEFNSLPDTCNVSKLHIKTYN